MPDFKKPIAKVADAASQLFLARLEAIDVILDGADPHEVLMVRAPGCCEQHLAEFEADLLQHLRECVAQDQETEDAAEAEAVDDTPPVRH
jgi:hypothetical protein